MPDTQDRTILVVDDEPEVRRLVCTMLAQFGYSTISADSGDHAIEIYKERNLPIDLLVTDVVAPGMSGPMLAEKLTVLQPGLKVLYISGYDRTTVVRKYVVEKGHALLSKPFTAAQFKEKLAEMLQPASAGGATG